MKKWTFLLLTCLLSSLAMSQNLYEKVIRESVTPEDLHRRQLIVSQLECLYTSYIQTSTAAWNQLLDDGTLIIKSKPARQGKGKADVRIKSRNQHLDKQKFLTDLHRAFTKHTCSDTRFDDVKVVRHPAKANLYGVSLHIANAPYHPATNGYVFLLWHFAEDSTYQIHILTWQPDLPNGTRVPEDEVFCLTDFEL